MCKFCKAVLKILSILTAIVGALFVVYFWNLDQKLLGWAYIQVNKIFDRKKVDIKFYWSLTTPSSAAGRSWPAPPRPGALPMTRPTHGRTPAPSSW